MAAPTNTDPAPGTGLERRVEVMPLIAGDEIDRIWRVAKGLAMSGMFKDATQAEQAFAKILLGRDLGLSPTQAMTGIHIIEGKPEVAAVTLGAFVKRRDGYDYAVRWRLPDGTWVDQEPEGDVTACRVTFTVDGREQGSSIWTVEDTKRAELDRPSRNGKPSNHTRFPRSMYFSRAMSQGVKRYVPECTGGIPVYHEGEIEAPQQVPNLAAGNGDGTDPGWQLTNPARVREVEHVLERAAQAGQPIDRAATQMMLNGQADAYVAEWLERVMSELPVEADPPEPEDATVVEPIGPVGPVADVGRVTQLRYDTDPEFRQNVDHLLGVLADYEADENPAGMAEAEGALDALDVPKNWFPTTTVDGDELPGLA